MLVLRSNFDYGCNQCSPVQVDYYQVTNHDEKGNEFVSYEKVDYPSIIKSHGSADMWSLAALVKAGVDPKFAIRTGFNTILELDAAVNRAGAAIDAANVEPSKE